MEGGKRENVNFFVFALGALQNIRNNENQTPYDLSAKNPEVGRLLMVRGKSQSGCGMGVVNTSVIAGDEAEGYGEDEDSD